LARNGWSLNLCLIRDDSSPGSKHLNFDIRADLKITLYFNYISSLNDDVKINSFLAKRFLGCQIPADEGLKCHLPITHRFSRHFDKLPATEDTVGGTFCRSDETIRRDGRDFNVCYPAVR
jgi:hypothetical protein